MRLVHRLFFVPTLNRTRIWAAMAVAVLTDGIQFALGPLGWMAIDQGLDIVAMALISWLVGFHLLLLPTVVLEAIPLVDLLPGWTVCTLAVLRLRKSEQAR